MMMIVSFITLNSNLAPLMRGLCRSNLNRFEFSVFGVLPKLNRRPEDLQSLALKN